MEGIPKLSALATNAISCDRVACVVMRLEFRIADAA